MLEKSNFRASFKFLLFQQALKNGGTSRISYKASMKSIILYTPLKVSLFSDVSENEESFFVGESSEKLKYDGQSYIPAVAQFY